MMMIVVIIFEMVMVMMTLMKMMNVLIIIIKNLIKTTCIKVVSNNVFIVNKSLRSSSAKGRSAYAEVY